MKNLLKIVFIQLFSLFVAFAAGAATMPETEAGTPGIPAYRPLLDGTFIQLLEQNGNWSRARWEKLFDSFQALGLKQIVVQWTLHDNRAFFTTKTFEQMPQPPLKTILELAEARGIKLYLGLAAESCYWEMIKQTPALQEEYLDRLRWKSERVAQEVAAVATGYNAFKGWYIPEEIDDLTWRPPKERILLYRHLKQLSGFLKKLTPRGMVVLSSFSNARMDPGSYEAFLDDLLRETPVDVLLFQDGAGGAKLPRELVPLYLKAARSAADANGKKLQVVVELFAEVSESPFRAIPAPISRIIRQLEVADGYTTDGINSFSVPDYMSYEGDAAAMELLRSYQRYKDGGHRAVPR
jgi:hypothetical protein